MKKNSCELMQIGWICKKWLRIYTFTERRSLYVVHKWVGGMRPGKIRGEWVWLISKRKRAKNKAGGANFIDFQKERKKDTKYIMRAVSLNISQNSFACLFLKAYSLRWQKNRRTDKINSVFVYFILREINGKCTSISYRLLCVLHCSRDPSCRNSNHYKSG